MMKYSILSILILLLNPIFGQEISFESKKLILDHPVQPHCGIGFPFIPFDFNNDGIMDLTGSSFADQLYLKGLSDDSFEEIKLNWSQSPIRIIDWDNDGDSDVIFQQHIRITGENEEFQLINPNLEIISESIADAADINNDSFMDFVTINRKPFEYNELAIYINNGDNTFEKTFTSNDDEFEAAIFGDVTLDGIPDLIYSGTSTCIGENNGDGTFTTSDEKLSGTDGDILLTDLDGDNDPDIVILAGIVKLYFNEGGTILKSSKKEIYDSADLIASGDFNGDGTSDLISMVFALESIDINLMQNDGTGNFDMFSTNLVSFPRLPIFGVPPPEVARNNVTIYDYDQDGKLDIIYMEGMEEPSAINVLRNNTLINSTLDLSTKKLTVFPNPTREHLFIDLDFTQYQKYEIIDISGKALKSASLESNEISTSGLPNGNYILKLYPRNEFDQIAIAQFHKF